MLPRKIYHSIKIVSIFRGGNRSLNVITSSSIESRSKTTLKNQHLNHHLKNNFSTSTQQHQQHQQQQQYHHQQQPHHHQNPEEELRTFDIILQAIETKSLLPIQKAQEATFSETPAQTLEKAINRFENLAEKLSNEKIITTEQIKGDFVWLINVTRHAFRDSNISLSVDQKNNSQQTETTNISTNINTNPTIVSIQPIFKLLRQLKNTSDSFKSTLQWEELNDVFNEWLMNILSNKQTEVVYKLFEWTTENSILLPNISFKTAPYQRLFKTAAEEGNEVICNEVVKRQRTSGQKLDAVCFKIYYNSVLNRHKQKDPKLTNFSDVHRNLLAGFGTTATLARTEGWLDTYHSQNVDWKYIWEVWMEMNRRAIKPTPMAVNAIVSSYFMNFPPQAAVKWYLDWIKQNKLNINPSTMRMVVNDFLRRQRPLDAINLLKTISTLENQQRGFPKSEESYNDIIQYLSGHDQIGEAAKLLDQLLTDSKIQLDVETATRFILKLKQLGHESIAFDFMKKFKQSEMRGFDQILKSVEKGFGGSLPQDWQSHFHSE